MAKVKTMQNSMNFEVESKKEPSGVGFRVAEGRPRVP